MPYTTEMSSPMFRTDGEGELEFEVVDEILSDRNMTELVKIAAQQAAIRGGIDWGEMKDYVQGIYEKYGSSPDLAEPADWDLIARSVHEDLVGKQEREVGQ